MTFSYCLVAIGFVVLLAVGLVAWFIYNMRVDG